MLYYIEFNHLLNDLKDIIYEVLALFKNDKTPTSYVDLLKKNPLISEQLETLQSFGDDICKKQKENFFELIDRISEIYSKNINSDNEKFNVSMSLIDMYKQDSNVQVQQMINKLKEIQNNINMAINSVTNYNNEVKNAVKNKIYNNMNSAINCYNYICYIISNFCKYIFEYNSRLKYCIW